MPSSVLNCEEMTLPVAILLDRKSFGGDLRPFMKTPRARIHHLGAFASFLSTAAGHERRQNATATASLTSFSKTARHFSSPETRWSSFKPTCDLIDNLLDAPCRSSPPSGWLQITRPAASYRRRNSFVAAQGPLQLRPSRSGATIRPPERPGRSSSSRLCEQGGIFACANAPPPKRDNERAPDSAAEQLPGPRAPAAETLLAGP